MLGNLGGVKGEEEHVLAPGNMSSPQTKTLFDIEVASVTVCH